MATVGVEGLNSESDYLFKPCFFTHETSVIMAICLGEMRTVTLLYSPAARSAAALTSGNKKPLRLRERISS